MERDPGVCVITATAAYGPALCERRALSRSRGDGITRASVVGTLSGGSETDTRYKRREKRKYSEFTMKCACFILSLATAASWGQHLSKKVALPRPTCSHSPKNMCCLFVAKLLRKCTKESAIIHVIYVTHSGAQGHTAAKPLQKRPHSR